MQFGYFAMPSHPPERPLKDGHEWDLQVIRWLDELGFAEPSTFDVPPPRLPMPPPPPVGLPAGPSPREIPLSRGSVALRRDRVFDELGYRRYEWKCDSCNLPSRAAATRLGFTYEGLFRQAMITRGHNRDTAWFSIVDREWAALRAAFEAWLDPGNFDADGRQRRSLASFRAASG